MSPLFFLPITFGSSLLFLILFIIRFSYSLMFISRDKSGLDLTGVAYLFAVTTTLLFINIMLIVT